jgi:hypothetical protein
MVVPSTLCSGFLYNDNRSYMQLYFLHESFIILNELEKTENF